MYYIKEKNGQWEHEGSFVGVQELSVDQGYELWKDGHCCGKISIVEGKVQLILGLRGTPLLFERDVFEKAYAQNLDFVQFLKLSSNLTWLEVLNEEGEALLTFGTQEESAELDFDYLSEKLSENAPKSVGFDFGCRYF